MSKYYIQLANENKVRTPDSLVRKRKMKEKSQCQDLPGENFKPNRWVPLKIGYSKGPLALFFVKRKIP